MTILSRFAVKNKQAIIVAVLVCANDAQAFSWKWIVDPGQVVAEKVVEKTGDAVGVNGQKVGELVNTPPLSAVEDGKKAVTVTVEVQGKHMKQLAAAVKEGRIDQVVVNEAQLAIANATDNIVADKAMKVAAISAMVPGLRGSMMDAPHIENINEGKFKGTSIYYVNGIDTSHSAAVETAKGISMQFRRPVGLIYNATDGVSIDLLQSSYDRLWPFAQLVPGNPQANPCTRQLAQFIYSAKKPTTIITHSQGCLIMRNALLTADNYSSKAAGKINWIALAPPLRDVELTSKPGKLLVVRMPDDPVAQSVGLELNPDKFTSQNSAAHNVNGYLSKVTLSDVTW